MTNPHVLLLSMLCLVAGGCGGRRVPPDESLERFKDYYAGEMFLIERSRLAGEDSIGLQGRLDSLRTAFSLSTGARDSLLAFYRDSLPRWEMFLNDVIVRLEGQGGGRGQSTGAESPASGTD